MTDGIVPLPPRGEPGQPGLQVVYTGFALSEELVDVAEALIRKHQRLAPLERHEVAYVLEHADLPAGGKYCDWAKARLVPKWARALTDFEACVTVNAKVWAVLVDQHREALMLHELLHLAENERTAELETVPHDVEEFGFVVAEYGAWRPALRMLAEQLELGIGR